MGKNRFGIQWVFLIFSSEFKTAASTRNILQLNISSENVNEEQLAMDLKKIFSVILWMLDDRIHSIGSTSEEKRKKFDDILAQSHH